MASRTSTAQPLGSAAESAQVINTRRFGELIEAAFNRGDLSAVDDYFLPGFVDHAPWPGHPADVAGFKAGLAEMRKSFPDLHVTVERTVAEGDLLAVHHGMSGSQLGEFMGAPASGKSFRIEAIDIVRMIDGRIAEHWGLIDTAAMAGQLGLQPVA
jgi:predicted ester cyclase